jgi:hypothetical protein
LGVDLTVCSYQGSVGVKWMLTLDLMVVAAAWPVSGGRYWTILRTKLQDSGTIRWTGHVAVLIHRNSF